MNANVMKNVSAGVLLGLRDAVIGIAAIRKLDSRWLEDGDTIFKRLSQDFGPLAALVWSEQEGEENPRQQSNNAEPNMYQRLVRCCLLNSVVLFSSLLFFDYVHLPGLRILVLNVCGEYAGIIWIWLESILRAMFSLFWVLPVYILTRVINCFWFSDIADYAFRHFQGKPKPFQLSSVKRLIVDRIFSCLMQVFFLIQSQLVPLFLILWSSSLKPLAQIIEVLHLSILYSLYIFEYKWCHQGKTFNRQLGDLEDNWPYFIGFGLPLALITWWPTSHLFSGGLFAFLCPWFIISAMQAVVEPRKMPPLHVFKPSLWITSHTINLTSQCLLKSK